MQHLFLLLVYVSAHVIVDDFENGPSVVFDQGTYESGVIAAGITYDGCCNNGNNTGCP